MVKCHSKERRIDDKGIKKEMCNEESIKECKHKFSSCKKHFHGCKNEFKEKW